MIGLCTSISKIKYFFTCLLRELLKRTALARWLPHFLINILRSVFEHRVRTDFFLSYVLLLVNVAAKNNTATWSSLRPLVKCFRFGDHQSIVRDELAESKRCTDFKILPSKMMSMLTKSDSFHRLSPLLVPTSDGGTEFTKPRPRACGVYRECLWATVPACCW